MNSLFLKFNHRLTLVQKDDARASLGVGRIIDLPPDLEKNLAPNTAGFSKKRH
jgi:hypothetical protein